jgi:hypothetical protein
LQLASYLVRLVEEHNGYESLINAILILFGNMGMKKKTDNTKLLKLLESKASKTEDARLVFCTLYRSSWLENQKFDILVIDEAANLKECESMIPLATHGIKKWCLLGITNNYNQWGKEHDMSSLYDHLSVSMIPCVTNDYFSTANTFSLLVIS